MSSVEDFMLVKAEWIKKGLEVSGQVCHGGLEVIKMQGDTLDGDHPRRWGPEPGKEVLLEGRGAQFLRQREEHSIPDRLCAR